MAFLREPTPLHIFVVTLRCEHSCPYCQVSRRSADKALYDMSEDTARRALDVAMSSPPPAIKIEFQGGEPLLNFGLIKSIVAATLWLMPVEPGPVSRSWVVSSRVAEQFEARAKLEEERKAKFASLMGSPRRPRGGPSD